MTPQFPLNRREFLKVCGTGAAALTLPALSGCRSPRGDALGTTQEGATVSIPLLFGPYGAATRPERLREYGANAIWFGGFHARRFEICAEHGLHACVEFPTFRADFNQRPDLIPIGADGQPIRYGELVQGVCLSKVDFLQEIEAKLREGVETFQPTGIWLDYLTYAGWFETPTPDLQESCFCRDCIADFQQATGIDADSPRQILSEHQSEWTDHKCHRIAEFGAHYAAIIREKLPNCVIGAYMCPWQPDEFDGALRRIFAQDYALLASSVDVFTPLIYASKSGRPADWGCEFMQASGGFIPRNRPVQLILDILDFPASLQATAACPRPSHGVQLFGGARLFEDDERATLFRAAVERIRQSHG